MAGKKKQTFKDQYFPVAAAPAAPAATDTTAVTMN